MFSNWYQNKHLVVAMKDDASAANRDVRIIPASKALDWNEKQYGIFFTVQGFNNNRRTLDNLSHINAWAIDMDEGTKLEQRERLHKAPILPSLIVESKRGFHVYWWASSASSEAFPEVMRRLISYFGADNRAKDLCRILRLPCMYHWKDPNSPYLVKEVYSKEVEYTDDDMLKAFPKKEQTQRRLFQRSEIDIDSVKGLKALSGKSCVRGDVFEFKRNGNGTHQIWVNGKSSSSWIDNNGNIGSHDKGGPTLIQWLKWYNYSTKDAIEILKGEGLL